MSMKTPEKIKRDMIDYMEDASCVTEYGDAHDLIDSVEQGHAPMADASAYIRLLEQANDHKDKRIRQLAREKEAMLRQLSMHCEACKYWESPMSCKECSTCTNPWKVNPKENWEWRGVEEEKHG
jgi:hypothetical protein